MLRKVLKITIPIVIALLLLMVFSNYRIEEHAQGKTYAALADIPHNKVGLVLGTSKRLSNGYINLYYKYRIEAAVSLFKSGKIDYIIISGDNGTKQYNEPITFKKDIVKAGIPDDHIFLDYAGFRTLDSVVRAKEIFGQESITVISQQFHNERAIYLAENFGIDAIGFNAQDVSKRYGFKVRLRECLARTKVFLDILFNVQPKFLGEKIEIK